jgi:hypothetical protein
MSARRRGPRHVYCRLDGETALVATSVSARQARWLAKSLMANYMNARIWISPRNRRCSTSWSRLRAQLSREQGRIHEQAPPETDEAEDQSLERGGKIHRLRWVSI